MTDKTEKKSSDTSDYDVDFENEEFDEIYNSLGKKDRKDLFEYKADGTFKAKFSVDEMKDILRDLNSPEVKDLYDNYLTSKERAFVDTVRLPERIEKIKGLGGHNKWKQENGILMRKENPESSSISLENPGTPPLPLSDDEEEEEKVFTPHSPGADMPPPPEVLEKDIELEEEIIEEKTKTSSQILFGSIVDTYYKSRPYDYESSKTTELEVRFGTRGIRRLTKNDYDNVIKTLKSFGFVTNNPNGDYSLKNPK